MTRAAETHLLLGALIDEFARCGVQHACTSPGSRNSPIVVSLVRNDRIRCWSHIDERSAGFFAVGAAKTTGRPVALTCTSGTAAANLAPAVVEAFHARVPLIVLTADRPAELRDVGAGQAIDQLKLYGDAVKWFVEIEPPDGSVASLRWMRQLACRAYWTAVADRPGPVHLNLPLREPLVLEDEMPEQPLPGRPDGAPWVRVSAPGEASAGSRSAPARGVIVAGQLRRDAPQAIAAVELADRSGWPLLADPLSGIRHTANAIATYDLLLRDRTFRDRTRPSIVVRVGDLPTSKPLRVWLAGLDDVPQLAIDPESAWQDPSGVVCEIDAGRSSSVLEQLLVEMPDSQWWPSWHSADELVGTALGREFGDKLSEPLVAARLGDWLGPDVTLFCASSMPIRDLELFLPARRPLPRVLAMRGANGIDGTISGAFGAVAAGGGPVVLLIGDVAFAHDIGALLAARRLGLALTIVLLNNDGGGIFDFLPVAEQDGFERHIATPHGLEFEHAAPLYGASYVRAESVVQLHEAVSNSVANGGVSMIEVRTDRADNLAVHRRLADQGLLALAQLSPRAPAASPGA